MTRTLNSVEKSTFVKYYYNFKNKSREECILLFDESYTDKAKLARIGHAQRIFREHKNIEALELITKSNRIDNATLEIAREFLQKKKNKREKLVIVSFILKMHSNAKINLQKPRIYAVFGGFAVYSHSAKFL